MSRSKRFLLSLLLVMALTLAFVPAAIAEGPITITILHTNDTHAHLESFAPFKQPLQGGVARRYTLIERIRAEGGNVILLDAGDVFQGTLYFNQYQGQADLYFMNAMGYDAMCVGNHEFDSGPAVLAAFIDGAQFPVISANIDVSAEPTLAGKIPAYTVLDVAGEKIAVFGLTTEDTPILSSPGPNVVFKDPISSAEATVDELEAQGINKIIALTHLGYSRDLDLAAAVEGIDVIVGGHSHTLLGDMEGAEGPYPTVVTSPAGEPVLVVTVKCWGSYLGRLDVTFTADGVVETYGGAPIFIDESIPENPEMAAKLAEYAVPIEELKATIIGQTAVDLDGEREHVRTQETNLGNLICDAMLWRTAADNTVIAIQNGGGIRASIPAGDVSVGQVLEVLPFGNTIVNFDLTGAEIVEALENGVSMVEEVKGRFPQVGGLRYTFNPDLPAGSRIISVEVWDPAQKAYAPLDLKATYRVCTNNFLYGGGDGYEVFKTKARNVNETGLLLSDVLIEYIKAHSPVSPAVEGRIAVSEALLPITGAPALPPRVEWFVVAGFGLIAIGVYIKLREREKVRASEKGQG